MDDDFWSLWPGVILGHEGDENADDQSDSGDNDDDDSNDDGDVDDQGQSSSEGETDLDKVTKALAAERRNSKRLERELRKANNEKAAVKQAESETIEEARTREAAANSRAEKLAAGILKRDIDNAIRDQARELKFIDVEDAVNGVDRTKITFDQDDEDPSDIDIDLDTVKSVVKALAAKKKHFIRIGTDDGEPTGSAHGGSRKRKTATAEEAYAQHYPNL